ncbi:MAG: GNAT family N-acetyltransferase [Pseudomonadota bacterium]
MARLAEAAYGVYRSRLGGMAPPAMRPDFAGFQRAGNAWVATIEGLLAGYVLAGPGDADQPGDPGPEVWVIDNIAVSPKTQGQGLGRRLLALAEGEGATRGFRRAYLLTNVVMTENQALYARLGWRETDRRPRKGTTVIDYEKALPWPE